LFHVVLHGIKFVLHPYGVLLLGWLRYFGFQPAYFVKQDGVKIKVFLEHGEEIILFACQHVNHLSEGHAGLVLNVIFNAVARRVLHVDFAFVLVLLLSLEDSLEQSLLLLFDRWFLFFLIFTHYAYWSAHR
jgi:hypothetical protein